MAVDARQVDAIAATLADLYRDAELALTNLIARKLREGLDSPVAERKLADIRALRRSAQVIIAALEADTGPAIREVLAAAFRHGYDNALAGIPAEWFPESGIGQAAAVAAETTPGFAAVEALASSLEVELGHVSANMLRNVLDAYRSVQASTAARILTGTQTRRQASQAAWQALTDRGVTSFVDSAGRRWRLSSYVEMFARTNAQRAATQAQVDSLDTIGVDLVYVSDSVQECHLCRPFEGRILRTGAGPTGEIRMEHATRDGHMLTVDVVATLPEARLAGLFHPNCRHSISAYLPGVTKLPEQPTADPEGDVARQRQRDLERRIRKHKERQEAALTDEAAKLAGKRVRAAQAELRAHLAAHPDLKRLPYRERIGAGNEPPAGRDDAAAALGPPGQPSLDGTTMNPLGRGTPEPGPAAPSEGPVGPGEGQLTLSDIEPTDDLTAAAEAIRAGNLALAVNLLTRALGKAKTRKDKAAIKAQRDELARRLMQGVPAAPRIADLTDAELDIELTAAMSGDFDEQRFNEISAEIDRREQAQQAEEARQEANRERAQQRAEAKREQQARDLAELLDAGFGEEEAVEQVYGTSIDQQRRDRAIADLREQGYAGAGFEDLARQAYRDFLHVRYLAAEEATRGNLVTRAGQNAGIDPITLFSGPEARARKWASDELKGWWDEHGRPTFEDFKAQLLGDSARMRDLRDQSGGDFLS